MLQAGGSLGIRESRSQKAQKAHNWDFFFHTCPPKTHPNPAHGVPGTPRPAVGAPGWRFSPQPHAAAGWQLGLSHWDTTQQMLSPISNPLTWTPVPGLSPGTRTHRLPDPGQVTRTWLPSLPATAATLSGRFRSKPEGTRRGHSSQAPGCLIPN